MPQEEKHALHIIDLIDKDYFKNQHILDFGSVDFMSKRFGKPPLSSQHMLQHTKFQTKNIGCKAQVQYKTSVQQHFPNTHSAELRQPSRAFSKHHQNFIETSGYVWKWGISPIIAI